MAGTWPARISCATVYSSISRPLRRSTGNAAWIASTTMLILVAPLIVEMDREQQLTEFESQASDALGGKL